MSQTLETFEIGNGVGDIGGEAIDLRNLDLTNTLIGSCAAELTQALGEADSNMFEQYHMSDGGIADIELTAFDSAIIQDSGIRPFTADPNSQELGDDVSELAEVLGKNPAKLSKKQQETIANVGQEAFHDLIARCVAEVFAKEEDFNKSNIAFANDDRYGWIDCDLSFNDKGEIDEADDSCELYTDDDFKQAEDNWSNSEFEALVDDICDGEFEEALADPKFTIVK